MSDAAGFMTLAAWTFGIATFLSVTNGASCGFAHSNEYQTQQACETARQDFEIALMPSQTPNRRISTTPCEVTARR